MRCRFRDQAKPVIRFWLADRGREGEGVDGLLQSWVLNIPGPGLGPEARRW